MKPPRSSLILCLLALLVLAPVPSLPGPAAAAPPEKCGAWRWGIKTLSDVNANQVDFTPKATTFRKLRHLEGPGGGLGKNTLRLRPAEYQVFRVRTRLLEHKWVCCRDKDDGDYHLVVADPNNRRRTMIMEIADPDCPGARESARVGALRAVRREYDDLIGQPPRGRFEKFDSPPLLYITGVGFFDAIHGQRGVAPNGIELHPVLDIEDVP